MGLRVKVRFIKKANKIHGKSYRKIKWYGGVICGIANGRRRVKIHYDDGTSEVANFPDKDIIVDDVSNGRHCENGSGGGSYGGAFVPMLLSSVGEEGGDEEEENEEQSGGVSERNQQERRPDLNEGEGGHTVPTEEKQINNEWMDEAEEVKSADEGGKIALSSDVSMLVAKSSISEECGCIIGRTTIAKEEITATLHDDHYGGIKMSSSGEADKWEAEEEEEEEEDGEIVESRPLAPSSGKAEKGSNGATLLKSNDKPQDEAPSRDAGNSSNDKTTQLQQMQQSKVNEMSSTVVEINTVDDLRVVENEVRNNVAKVKDAGCGGGVDSTPPTVVSVTQAAATDHSEQDLLKKKKKKRGPLSIHIGLPSAKRKKLIDEGMKVKPQDETAIATANSMDEIGVIRGNVSDDDAVKVDKSSRAISAHLEVESPSSGAQMDSASFDTTHVKGHEGCGDSLSDGEIQEGSEARKAYPSIMEIEPKEVSHH